MVNVLMSLLRGVGNKMVTKGKKNNRPKMFF